MEITIHELFETLANTSSSNDRKLLIKQALESDKRDLIMQIFEDCYGPAKYNITSDRILNDIQPYSIAAMAKERTTREHLGCKMELTIDEDYEIFHNMLNNLAARMTTGYAAVEYATSVLMRYQTKDLKILRSIIDKNLKVGFSLEQLNKLQGKKKKDFEVSLAFNLDDVKGVDPVDGTYFASRKLDGCVSGDTLITMADGTRLPIKYIVENEIVGKVLSYNTKTGKLEKDDICGHLKNGVDVNQKENTHQWYEIELEDGRKIKLTGNHKVYLPDLNCYRRVDELHGDENLLVI